MNPQTINAGYNPLMNQITFPAAILQAPFFDPNADPAVNYGAIGAVIGHEIGHGFDDQGREFDETGKIRNWWSDGTNKKFLAQTEKLAAQYDAFCPLPNTCVNGKLTMGENIGDLGGLEMAYAAYKVSLKGKEAPVLGGFTGDQRFFMAHAQVWRALMRDDALRNLILTNPHAPAGAARLDGRAQHGRLVRRLRRQAGRQGIPARRSSASTSGSGRPLTAGRGPPFGRAACYARRWARRGVRTRAASGSIRAR